MGKNKDDHFGCILVFIVIAVILMMAVCSSLAPDTGMYREGNLRLKVYTAKVDERQALKLLAAGKRQEAEEYLSRAEEKLSRGQEEKADATFLTDLQAAVGQIKSEHAADINPIRKRRAKERLRWKAEQTRSALRALEYRNQAWGEVLKIVQDRLGRQAAGAESYVESPFRVDSTALRGALSRRYGESYVREMERLAPGVCESAVKDAEALAEQAGAQSAR